MKHEWITDRLPTEADADGGGDVRVPRDPEGLRLWYQHYGVIVPGQPWWSEKAAERVEVEPVPVPAPTRNVDWITAAGSELYALCDDDTIWILGHPGWTQLPAIPQPEA
jgi:hypothetical protein